MGWHGWPAAGHVDLAGLVHACLANGHFLSEVSVEKGPRRDSCRLKPGTVKMQSLPSLLKNNSTKTQITKPAERILEIGRTKIYFTILQMDIFPAREQFLDINLPNRSHQSTVPQLDPFPGIPWHQFQS